MNECDLAAAVALTRACGALGEIASKNMIEVCFDASSSATLKQKFFCLQAIVVTEDWEILRGPPDFDKVLGLGDHHFVVQRYQTAVCGFESELSATLNVISVTVDKASVNLKAVKTLGQRSIMICVYHRLTRGRAFVIETKASRVLAVSDI